MKKIFLSLALLFGGTHAFSQSDEVVNDRIQTVKLDLKRCGQYIHTACVADAVLIDGLRDSYRIIMNMYDTLQALPRRIILGEVIPTSVEEFSGEDFKTVFYFSNMVGAEMWVTLDEMGTVIESKVKTSEVTILDGDLYVNRGAVVVYEEKYEPEHIFLCPLSDLLRLIYQCKDGYVVLDIRQPGSDRPSFLSKAFRLEDMLEIPLSPGGSWLDFK